MSTRTITRHLLPALLLVIGVLCARYVAPSSPAALAVAETPAPSWYRVERVVDGDTVVLDMGGKSVTVRLIGLDTPEVVDPKKPVQCYGPEASKEAHAKLDGQVVRLETDPTQGQFDKYGRTLGYVFLSDGADFDELMIRQGFGREYTYKKAYRYQAEFKAAQLQAQVERLGLWSVCL